MEKALGKTTGIMSWHNTAGTLYVPLKSLSNKKRDSHNYNDPFSISI